MKKLACVVLFLFYCPWILAQLSQPPSIKGVQNAASNAPDALPYSEIAPGSMFVIKGIRMGPNNTEVATDFPLPTEIAGTSVQISIGGLALDGIMYYSLNTQVAVILPSTAPAGEGTVTVTYQGQVSQPYPIKVVPHSLGLFTLLQNGSGAAVAFLNGASLISAGNSVNPGEVAVFWGTGLGAVQGDDSMPAQQSDLTNVPVSAFVGGQPAEVLFRGRNACCASIDTVYVKVPDGVSGCMVPVMFTIGDRVSNISTVSIAESGRTCEPNVPWVSREQLGQLVSQDSVRNGVINLGRGRNWDLSGSPPPLAEAATGVFSVSRPLFEVGLWMGSVMYGQCTTSSGGGSYVPLKLGALAVGDQIEISGPGGKKVLTPNATSLGYYEQRDLSDPILPPGSYMVTADGSADVPAFTTMLNVPAEFQADIESIPVEIDRSQDLVVRWSGGDPDGYVLVRGRSSATSLTVIGTFWCYEKTSAGTLTIPAIILGTLPASSVGSNGFSIGSYSLQQFQAEGLDFGLVGTSDEIAVSGFVFK